MLTTHLHKPRLHVGMPSTDSLSMEALFKDSKEDARCKHRKRDSFSMSPLREKEVCRAAKKRVEVAGAAHVKLRCHVPQLLWNLVLQVMQCLEVAVLRNPRANRRGGPAFPSMSRTEASTLEGLYGKTWKGTRQTGMRLCGVSPRTCQPSGLSSQLSGILIALDALAFWRLVGQLRNHHHGSRSL